MEIGTRAPQSGGWRNQILDHMEQLFAREGPSFHFGLDHALAVERAVLSMLDLPQSRLTDEMDVNVLRSAALLHDVGLVSSTAHWSPDCYEHLETGQELATEILGCNPLFRDCPDRLSQVLQLIGHHDDTAYSFATATRGGQPFLSSRMKQEHPLSIALGILQEADSLTHVVLDCALEVAQDWLDAGMSMFSPGPAPLETWRWMDSVAGNIRLLAKRAIIDARTPGGSRQALDAYSRLEEHLETQCGQVGIAYEPEACHPTMRSVSLERLAGKSFDLEIVDFQGWTELDGVLRAVPLMHDKSIHPYKQADIRLDLIELKELTPTALYVMRNRLDEVLELHDALMAVYCLGIWDLPGLLRFRYNSEGVQTLAPPVVEEYVETAWNGNSLVTGLVDGLHRCMTARKAGVAGVRAIVASRVPCPLVPLPVHWKEIKTYEDHEPPPDHLKRRYRYQTLTDFSFGSCPSDVPITEDNFRYFYYRDLSELGSRGKRDFCGFKSRTAH